MFDAISELILYKIQSHDDSHFKFKRTGVHRIAGDNSNGKSVAFKACDALFFGEGINKEGRNSLISVDSDYGIVSASSFNGINLTLFLHLESKHSFYKLTIRNKEGVEESVVKYLIDDYRELLKIANFHWMQEEGYSLNRYKTKTALPFTHFTGTMNYKVLDSASENPKYTQMLEIIDENYKEVRMDREINERRVVAMKEQLKSLDDSNLNEVNSLLMKLKTLQKTYDVLETLYTPVSAILKVDEELGDIKTIDVSHYKTLKPMLETLDQMGLSLNNVIESEEKINNHDLDTREPVVDLKQLLSSLERVDTLSTLTENIYQASVTLSQHKDLEVVELDDLLGNMKDIQSVKENLDSMIDTSTELERMSDISVINLNPILDSLSELEVLNSTLNSIINYSEQLHELDSDDFDLVDLSDLLESVETLHYLDNKLSKLSIVATHLDDLNRNDFKPIDLSGLLNSIRNLESLSSKLDKHIDKVLELNDFDEKQSQLVELDELLTALGGLSSLSSKLDKYTGKVSELNDLNDNDFQLVKLDELLNGVDTLRLLSKQVNEHIRFEEELSKLDSITYKDITPILDIFENVERLKHITLDLEKDTRKLDYTNNKIYDLTLECEQLAQQIGICSSCGSLLNRHKEVC